MLLLLILVGDDNPCTAEGIFKNPLLTGYLKQGCGLNPSFRTYVQPWLTGTQSLHRRQGSASNFAVIYAILRQSTEESR